MKPEITLSHEFVEYLPSELHEGILYISMQFATASHLCACGCKQRVVTPLTPTDWSMIYDGQTISLEPSVGNWSFACRSHYWIHNSRVHWAGPLSQKQIELGRKRDRAAKQAAFAQKPLTGKNTDTDFPKGAEKRLGSSRWLKKWMGLGDSK